MAVGEEARPDEPLAVPHEIVAEQSRVHSVSSPPPHPVSHADHVRVPLGLVPGLRVRGGAGAGADLEVGLGPFVHMASDEVSVVSDLPLDNVVDVVADARFGKAAHSSDCKKEKYLSEEDTSLVSHCFVWVPSL